MVRASPIGVAVVSSAESIVALLAKFDPAEHATGLPISVLRKNCSLGTSARGERGAIARLGGTQFVLKVAADSDESDEFASHRDDGALEGMSDTTAGEDHGSAPKKVKTVGSGDAAPEAMSETTAAEDDADAVSRNPHNATAVGSGDAAPEGGSSTSVVVSSNRRGKRQTRAMELIVVEVVDAIPLTEGKVLGQPNAIRWERQEANAKFSVDKCPNCDKVLLNGPGFKPESHLKTCCAKQKVPETRTETKESLLLHPAVKSAQHELRCVFCNKPHTEIGGLARHLRELCTGGDATRRHIAAATILVAKKVGVSMTPLSGTLSQLEQQQSKRSSDDEIMSDPSQPANTAPCDHTLSVEASIPVSEISIAPISAELFREFWDPNVSVSQLPPKLAACRRLAFKLASVGAVVGGATRDLIRASHIYARQSLESDVARKRELHEFSAASFKDFDVSTEHTDIESAIEHFRSALGEYDLGPTAKLGTGVAEFTAGEHNIQVIHRAALDYLKQPLAFSCDGLFLTKRGDELAVGGTPDLLVQNAGASHCCWFCTSATLSSVDYCDNPHRCRRGDSFDCAFRGCLHSIAPTVFSYGCRSATFR